jgi:Calcium binding
MKCAHTFLDESPQDAVTLSQRVRARPLPKPTFETSLGAVVVRLSGSNNSSRSRSCRDQMSTSTPAEAGPYVTRPSGGNRKSRDNKLREARLDELIEQATVDAYDESEQMVGFHTMLDEHLDLPFSTEVLGVEVAVEQVDISDDNHIVAICRRNRSSQRIPILDLPLPTPPPQGTEWIDAYRRWARGR